MNISSTKIKENKKLDGFYLEYEENTKSLYEITTYYQFIIIVNNVQVPIVSPSIMQASVKYADFHRNKALTKTMIEAKRKIESLHFTVDEIGGGKFRSKLVETLKSKSTHEKFLLFDEDTALIVQVSSPGGAYSKLLDILLAKNEGQIKRCLFVTQTHQMAVRRNSIKNPGTDKDGHRVYFSLAIETIGNYSEWRRQGYLTTDPQF